MKRITEVRSNIATKQARMQAIFDACEKESRSRTEAETKEWRTLKAEVDPLKQELLDLEEQQRMSAATATPVARLGEIDNSNFVEDRSFTIKKHIPNDISAPISQWVLRNYDIKEATQKADPYKVIRAMGSGITTDSITSAALQEVRSVSGGSNMLDSYLSAKVLENMLQKSHLANAGMNILPMEAGSHLFGRISTFPVFEWLAPGATQTEKGVTFDAVSLSAKTLRAWSSVTREFLQDGLNVENVLKTAFIKSGSAYIDGAGLEGTGAGEIPSGLASMSGVSSFSMGTNGAAMTNYDPFIDISKTILEANGNMPDTAIMAPSRWATINKLKEATTNAPLARPASIQNWNFLETSSIATNRTQGTAEETASNIYVGNFNMLTLGVRLGLEVRFVNTDAATNSMDILATFRGDFASQYAPALGKIIGVL